MIEISDGLRRKLTSKEYEPILILEIEGLPTCSSAPANKVLRFDDDYLFDDVVFFDQSVRDRAINVLIDIKGQNNSMTQNLNQDTGGDTAATTFTVSLVDHRGIVTEWITPGAIIDDILGSKAKVWLNVKNGIHPEDSVLLLNGMIDGYTSETNRINLNLVSPEKYKQGDLFPRVSTTIVSYPAASTTFRANVASGQADLPAVSTAGFPETGSVIGYSRRLFLLLNGVDVATYYDISGNDFDYDSPYDVTQVHNAYTTGQTIALYQILLAGYTRGIDLVDASQFLEPSADGALECYVKIDDEIIRYEVAYPGGVATLTRGCFGTIDANHDYGAEVEPLYRLQGTMSDLALKIMLSGGEEEYFYELEGCNLETEGSTTIANAVWIDDPRFLESGVVVGDLATITDSASNNVTYKEILSITETATHFYIVIDHNISAEEDVTLKIKSKYNTLPRFAGLGMTPDLVDIAEHERIADVYFTQLFSMDLLIKDQIKGAELINRQLYLPNGCFSIPRKGRASLGIVAAPAVSADMSTLDETNVIGGNKIKIARSLNKNFFNAVTFQYEKDQVTDEYLRNNAYVSGPSLGRIKKIPLKSFKVKADGVRYSATSDLLIQDTAKRILDRFQYGAETFEIKVLYSVGLLIEIGDNVIFDGTALNMSDTKTGIRGMRPRIMSVYNKTIRPWANEVTLTLIDTSFSVNARYGTLAPASTVTTGSTAAGVLLAVSSDTNLIAGDEASKWNAYIGQTVAVRSADWTNYDEKRILNLDTNMIILESDLSFTPAAGDIVEPPLYPAGVDPEEQKIWKLRHCFLNATVDIVGTAPSADRFEVDPSDIAKFIAGAVVILHNADYSELSEEKIIDSISGNFVILTTDVSFIPDADHVVELIGYEDGGQPYRWA